MKKFIIYLCMMLLTSVSFAQSNPFEKFTEMDGVTSVYISKNMLKMMPKSANMNYGGVNVGNFIHKLSSIYIISTENQSIGKQLISIANNQVRHGYELLMRVKSEDNDNVNFYMKGRPESIRELIMTVASKDDDNVVIQFLGDFTMKDVEQMTSGINSGGKKK